MVTIYDQLNVHEVRLLCISQYPQATPGKFLKTTKSPHPGKFFGQIPGGCASRGPLILLHFTIFTIFTTSIYSLPIKNLQIRRENGRT